MFYFFCKHYALLPMYFEGNLGAAMLNYFYILMDSSSILRGNP